MSINESAMEIFQMTLAGETEHGVTHRAFTWSEFPNIAEDDRGLVLLAIPGVAPNWDVEVTEWSEDEFSVSCFER